MLHYSLFRKCEYCLLIICMCSNNTIFSFIYSHHHLTWIVIPSNHSSSHHHPTWIVIPSNHSPSHHPIWIVIPSNHSSSHHHPIWIVIPSNHSSSQSHHHPIFWISQESLTGITMCKSACHISKLNVVNPFSLFSHFGNNLEDAA